MEKVMKKGNRNSYVLIKLEKNEFSIPLLLLKFKVNIIKEIILRLFKFND